MPNPETIAETQEAADKKNTRAEFVTAVRQAYYSNSLKIAISGLDKTKLKKLAVIDDHGLEGLAIAVGQFDVKILKTLPEPILYRWFGNLDEDETLDQFNSKIELMYNYRVKKINDSMAANHVAFWFFPILSLLFATFFLFAKIPDEDKYGVTRALGVFCSLFFLLCLKFLSKKKNDVIVTVSMVTLNIWENIILTMSF